MPGTIHSKNHIWFFVFQMNLFYSQSVFFIDNPFPLKKMKTKSKEVLVKTQPCLNFRILHQLLL